MTWRLPFVSRLAFEIAIAARDSERARADRLEAAVLAMRRDGFTASKPATVRESPDDDTHALARAEHQFVRRREDMSFVRRAQEDIMRRNPGIPATAALQEAVALRRSVTDEDPPG